MRVNKIQRRIRAVHALLDSPNKAEASAAALKLESMLQQYNLTLDDILSDEISLGNYEIRLLRITDPYEVALAVKIYLSIVPVDKAIVRRNTHGIWINTTPDQFIDVRLTYLYYLRQLKSAIHQTVSDFINSRWPDTLSLYEFG